MIGFLDLSREIRDMIYELALVVDDIIVPYSEFYALSKEETRFRKNMPAVGLLGTSEKIGAEAAEILYGKNTWRVTSSFQRIAYDRNWEDTIWARRATLFRRVILVFSQVDTDPCELRRLIQTIHDEAESEVVQQQDRVCFGNTHKAAEIAMHDSWSYKFYALYALINLQSVKLDVSSLYCHAGCCRVDILERLAQEANELGFRWRFEGVESLFTGLRSQEENNLVRGLGFTTDFEKKEQ